MDKQQLRELVCQRLETDLALLVAAADDARRAATHEESRAENKYDTRGLEASYLAAGQSRRVEEIRQALAAWRSLELRDYDDELGIQLGVLISLQDRQGQRQLLLLGPDGAGLKLKGADGEILLITAQAPLGRALLGQGPGDELTVGNRSWQILHVD